MKTRPLNHSQLFMILFNQGQMSLWYEKKLSLSTSKGKTVKMSYVVVSKCSTFADLESRKLSWRGKNEVIAMIKGQTTFEEIYSMDRVL